MADVRCYLTHVVGTNCAIYDSDDGSLEYVDKEAVKGALTSGVVIDGASVVKKTVVLNPHKVLVPVEKVNVVKIGGKFVNLIENMCHVAIDGMGGIVFFVRDGKTLRKVKGTYGLESGSVKVSLNCGVCFYVDLNTYERWKGYAV